jgi:hypothetical protein
MSADHAEYLIFIGRGSLEKRCLSYGGPRVRIHFPPAGSQVRTRPHGFGNLPPASHASAPPIAELARHLAVTVPHVVVFVLHRHRIELS